MNFSPENPYGKGLDNPLVQKYQNYGLPILAVLETILTKGKSPGTTAMNQQQIFRDAADKRVAYENMLEQAKGTALERKVKEAQLGDIERKKTTEEEKLAKLKAFQGKLKDVATDDERQGLVSQYLQETDPETWAKELAKSLQTKTENKQNKSKFAMQLRKEYSDESQDYTKIRQAYQGYQGALKRNKGQDSGASDIALIFTYMKTLDPRSTVREGEYATVASAGGVPSWLLSTYNKLMGGGLLDNNVRKQVKIAMTGMYNEEVNRQIDRRNTYQSYAKDYEIDDPELVTKHIRIEPIDSQPPKAEDFIR